MYLISTYSGINGICVSPARNQLSSYSYCVTAVNYIALFFVVPDVMVKSSAIAGVAKTRLPSADAPSRRKVRDLWFKVLNKYMLLPYKQTGGNGYVCLFHTRALR